VKPIERLSWYTLSTESQPSPRSLASALQARRFTETNTSGFVLDEVRPGHLSGRYVQRSIVLEQVTDPFGNTVSNERVVFNQVRFRYQSAQPQLELTDSPRAKAAFVAELMVALDARATIAPVQLDVRSALRALEKTVGKVVVSRLDVRGVALDGAVVANLVFEGAREVRKSAAEFLQTKDFPIARARANWNQDGSRVLCEITVRGVRFPAESDELLRPILRSIIAQVTPDE
jgi:hypothetical protein